MIQSTSSVSEMEKKMPYVQSQAIRRGGSGQTSQLDAEISRRKGSQGSPGGNGKSLRKSQALQRAHVPQPREKNFSKIGKKVQGEDSKDQALVAATLLNFQYEPAHGSLASFGGRVHQPILKRRRVNTFNKEVFLQACCHFVVKDSGDYSLHAVDPDLLVDWNLVELVYLPTHDVPQCPICLYPPVAGKITRCGHVFCWSCILHYLHLGEKTWRKCPICHEALHASDLRSVIPCQKKLFARSDLITMRLMKREKHSLLAYPVGDAPSGYDFPMWTGSSSLPTAKLMVASSASILHNIVLKEKSNLEAQLLEAQAAQSGEECFIEAALAKVKEKESLLFKVTAPAKADKLALEKAPHAVPEPCTTLAKMLIDSKDGGSSVDEEPAFSDGEDEIHVDFGSLGLGIDVNCPSSSDSGTGLSPDQCKASHGSVRHDDFDEVNVDDPDSYYFYQAADGQHIFIHPLNARCLVEEYGSLGASPRTISGQIIDYDSFTMAKALRKRFRYLSHLPVACEFVVCELMLKPPILSRQTVRSFMPEFRKRKEMRMRKQEEMKRFEKKATRALRAHDGFGIPDDDSADECFDLGDMTSFPCTSTLLEVTRLSPGDDLGERVGARSDAKPDDTSAAGSLSDVPATSGSVGPSFAQMLKSADSARAKTMSSGAGAGALGRTCVAGKPGTAAGKSDEEEEHEPPPTFQDMFSSALTALHVAKESGVAATPDAVGAKKVSRKKTKGTLLFATCSQRKY